MSRIADRFEFSFKKFYSQKTNKSKFQLNQFSTYQIQTCVDVVLNKFDGNF